MKKILFLIFICTVIVQLFSVVLTSGTGSLTTDNYGVVSDFRWTRLAPPATFRYLDYSSTFFVFNGGEPLEVSDANAELWDNNPPAPYFGGFFMPGIYENWEYVAGVQEDVWNTKLEYHAPGIDIVSGTGYKLISPGTFGTTDWMPVTQIQNLNANPLIFKMFRYWRINPQMTVTAYQNGYDGAPFTSDDYTYSYNAADVNNNGQLVSFPGFPITHARVQQFNAPTLYNSLVGGAANYNLTNNAANVGGHTENAFQYPEITLQQNQAALYWVYGRPIIVNNSFEDHPTDIDYDEQEVTTGDLNTDFDFIGDSGTTDVSMNFSALTLVGGLAPADQKVVFKAIEITGGMVESGLAGDLDGVSKVRYWEIFAGTRLDECTVDITFTYNVNFDGVTDEANLQLAYRSDYDQAWTKYPNVQISRGGITAQDVAVPAGQWILASNTNQPLPVELASFNAAVTASKTVNLEWVTMSESEIQGYNIYRNTELNLTNAQKMNNLPVPSKNSLIQTTYNYTDNEDIEPGNTYYYWLQIEETGGTVRFCKSTSVTVKKKPEDIIPVEIPYTKVESVYPNPFNPNTTIKFSVKTDDIATLDIYNSRGQKVICLGEFGPGYYNKEWNGKDATNKSVGSGVYFYRLTGKGYQKTGKLMLLK